MNRYKIPVSVLVVIHTRDLDVLLLERADRPGFWQSVTGSQDDEGEMLRDTAIRELKEETGLEYASRVVMSNAKGESVPVMHACGHDAHIASWVGAAMALAGARDRWSGTLVFLGQPA